MARVIGKLSETKIRSLINKPANGSRCRYHSDGGGLFLCLSSSAARSWIYRYMIAGRGRYMGIVPYPDVSLANAREIASDARRLKGLGKDPIEERKTERAAKRFEAACAFAFRDCVKSYIDANRPSWKNEKHAG